MTGVQTCALPIWCVAQEQGGLRSRGTPSYSLPYRPEPTAPAVLDADGKPRVAIVREEGSNDKVGYFGSDPGITVEVPAGSVVAFTSFNFHSSGSNNTDRLRRVYLTQYSCEPITNAEGTKLWGNAEPLLLDGEMAVGAPVPEVGPAA